MEYTYLNPQREALWEAIIDHLDVIQGVNLMERDYLYIMVVMLAAHWENVSWHGKNLLWGVLKIMFS